jgi:uncharacterized cysteine cluster protein YcgN (CxxCxxCC family)
MDQERPFWETKALSEMTTQEWESLCDSCGKCCLLKLEDEDSGQVHYTRVACRYLDQRKCRCTVYSKRQRLVPTCVKLRPDELDALLWMPSTCAYRLLHEGRPLPIWHPLIAGSRQAMKESGNTVTGRVISEDFVHEEGLIEHIVQWPS